VAEVDLAELPAWALELLRSEPVAHLGLLDDEGHPRVLPVTFALAGDRLYSAVDEKPKLVPGGELARVRYLRRHPSAALTVDRYDDDWSKLAWVQVLGAVQVLDDPTARPEGLAALRAKYDPYRHQAPAGPLLELTPKRTLYWTARAPAVDRGD